MRRTPIVVGLLGCGMVTAGSQAQPRQAPDPDPSVQTTIAQNHLENGNRYYALGRYDDAAREFERGFELTRRPEFLFNMARAQEDGHHPAEAVATYERFLAVGSPGADRAEIARRIEQLRATLSAAPPPPPPSPPPPPPPAVPWPPVGSLVLYGAAGTALLASVVTGLLASSIYSDLERTCQNSVCPASLQGDIDRGRTLTVATDVLWISGAALAVGATLWLLAAPRGIPRAPRVGALCAPGGCAGALSVAF